MSKHPGICESCGRPWIDHMGMTWTCEQLQKALTALRVIHTWASFQDGSELNPEHVKKLIDITLEEYRVKYGK